MQTAPGFIVSLYQNTFEEKFQLRLSPPEPSPFLLEKKKEIILTGITAGSLAAGFLILKNDPVTIEELANLDTENIPGLERYVTTFDPIQAFESERLSDQFLFASGVAGIASVFLTKNREQDLATNLVMYVEGICLTVGLTETLKKSTDRKRPYVYNTILTDEQRTDEESAMSFPSGHASFSAFNSFFAAMLINNYLLRKESNIVPKILLYAGAAGISAVTGYLRTEAGKHFWTDVAVGYVLGAGIGIGIPLVHKSENINVSFKTLISKEMQGFSCVIEL